MLPVNAFVIKGEEPVLVDELRRQGRELGEAGAVGREDAEGVELPPGRPPDTCGRGSP